MNVEGGEAPDKEQLGSASVSSDGLTFSTCGGLHVSVEDTKRFADPKLGDSLAFLHPRRSQVSAPPPKPFLRLRIDVPVVPGITVEFPRRLP